MNRRRAISPTALPHKQKTHYIQLLLFAVASEALHVLESELSGRLLAVPAAHLAGRRVAHGLLGRVRVGADRAQVRGDVVWVRRAGLCPMSHSTVPLKRS